MQLGTQNIDSPVEFLHMLKAKLIFSLTGFLALTSTAFALDDKTQKAYDEEVHLCSKILLQGQPFLEKVRKLCPKHGDPCDSPEVKELMKKRAAFFDQTNECLTAVHAKYKKLAQAQQAEARPLVEGRDYPPGAKPRSTPPGYTSTNGSGGK
jgi:hypothetical protein